MLCFLTIPLYYFLISIVRAVIYMIIPSIITIISINLISIGFIFHDFYYAYLYLFYRNARIGRNVRFLLFFFIPFAILLSIASIAVFSVFFSIFGYLFFAFTENITGDNNNNIFYFKFSTRIYEHVYGNIKEFYNYNKNSYPLQTRLYTIPNPDNSVFEISIIQLLLGIILGVVGSVIGIISLFIMAVVKFLPAFWLLFKTLTDLLFSIRQWVCCFIIPYFIALAIGSVMLIFIFPISILYGIFFGLLSIDVLINEASFYKGLASVFNNIYELDLKTNKELFGENCGSLLSCFAFQHSAFQHSAFQHSAFQHSAVHPLSLEHSNNYNTLGADVSGNAKVGTKTISLNEIWSSFFEMCILVGNESTFITLENLNDLDEFLFVGLPALVIYKAIERSAVFKNDGILLATDEIITRENLPQEAITNQIYDKIFNDMCRGRKIFKELQLTIDEKSFIEKWLITFGQWKEKEDLVKKIEQERYKKIIELISLISGLAIVTSRLPFFLQNINNSLNVIKKFKSGNKV